jgi:hypothetical protein
LFYTTWRFPFAVDCPPMAILPSRQSPALPPHIYSAYCGGSARSDSHSNTLSK